MLRALKICCLLIAFTLGTIIVLGIDPATPADYKPLWPDLSTLPDKAEAGSLTDEFAHAARAATPAQAVERWSAFLKARDPKSGDFEDAVHRRYVLWARFELMRALYRAGKAEEADELARTLANYAVEI